MEDYARDCAAVIDAFCGGQAAVAGLSLGGLVTQATAIAFPDKVRLAIPMGTAAYIDGFTRDWMQAEIDLPKARASGYRTISSRRITPSTPFPPRPCTTPTSGRR
jgi:pimeloyl-ACP methyl ester carboxylesterase